MPLVPAKPAVEAAALLALPIALVGLSARLG
jgi:hypothetical protein